MAKSFKAYDPSDAHPPYFTGGVGPRGGPEWLAPTAEYMGKMEVAPEIHALTEGGGRYTSTIYPHVEINPGEGHYIGVRQNHPKDVEEVSKRWPDKPIHNFQVTYEHLGDTPALAETKRGDLSKVLGKNVPDAISHYKELYAGDDPREAQRAAVEAAMRVHQHVFHDRREEGRRG